ncbi:MAG: hypothetical protein R6U40_11890 [Desulfobacterales bacterium]
MNAAPYINALRHYVEASDFAGYDPYDALKSPIIRRLTFGAKYGRIAWTQLFRRLPINLRPILRVPKGHNPKALGLFLGSYVRLYALEKREEYLQKIDYLLDLLRQNVSDGYAGPCWGYDFVWQSRAAFVPAYTPTVVNSAFIGHALLDIADITGNQNALQLAVSIADFIRLDLNQKKENGGICFSYTPVDDNFVHNANLLGASLLIRIYKRTCQTDLKDLALLSLKYSMDHQHADGSWIYAETGFQGWIDSFHTGFNLQAMHYFLKAGEGVEYWKQFEKGVHFYKNKFFEKNGTPKYYHNQKYPIDIHSPAQAIVFFSEIGTQYKTLTDKILKWMLSNMWNARGYFNFRKGKWVTNRIPYMRWSQAWALHALTTYQYNLINR